jgi:hypothetical protein
MNSEQWAQLLRRYVIAYLSLLGVVAAFAIVSIVQGAGWRPALVATPLYVVVFAAITYKLIRDVIKLRKSNVDKSDEEHNW